MKQLVVIIFLLSGCVTTLQTQKPFQIETITKIERPINNFTDNRYYILEALIQIPCFLDIDRNLWISWLNTYGKDDLDGFIEWIIGVENEPGVLYIHSGGQFLNDYFKQVKVIYKGMKNEK
mgnify:CR=1 FL=1